MMGIEISNNMLDPVKCEKSFCQIFLNMGYIILCEARFEVSKLACCSSFCKA